MGVAPALYEHSVRFLEGKVGRCYEALKGAVVGEKDEPVTFVVQAPYWRHPRQPVPSLPGCEVGYDGPDTVMWAKFAGTGDLSRFV